MESYLIPCGSAEQAVVLLLAGEPPIQAMLMIAVATLALGFLAGNVWVVEQSAVGAGDIQVFSADAAAGIHGVTDAVCHCIPLLNCVVCFRSR